MSREVDARWLEEILREARAAGATEAEVFRKTGRGRRVALEPTLTAGGRARVTVSTSDEEGIAVRLRNHEGGWGFAWGSPSGLREAFALVEVALTLARPPAAGDDPAWGAPCAPPHPPGASAGDDLAIDDPEVMTAPVERLGEILHTAAEAAMSHAAGAAEVDRVLLSAAATSVTLVNSRGFRGAYDKSLALLSVSMAPAVPGSAAVLEERAACRLSDLDVHGCGREAAWRAAPPRPATPPPAQDLPLILSGRAAASFLSALVPWILSAAGTTPNRPAAPECFSVIDDGCLPGGFGSAPFDGLGCPTRRRTLISSGRKAGQLSARDGHVVRHSFRDLPVIGLSNLYIPPASEVGVLLADPLLDPAAERLAERVSHPAGPCLRVTEARFVPGPDWRVRVLKGDWQDGGSPLGPADGLAWEGPLERILAGITAVGSDLCFFHLGMPVGSPSLRIEGLGKWMVEAAAGRRPARSPYPPSP
ncbi:MAG TPA: metallopeptidase TldD-related protein, partial [Candidatus Polarisedimenticolia bacterium]|nr:metallopeptidase TldD-related protein [Candidatus Polarisedimenticolia bacterium]